MNIEKAWTKLESMSHTKTKVAVIDTGVDVDHEDLTENLTSTTSYKQVNAGSVTDATSDTGYHGTHVAGIIGATYGNATYKKNSDGSYRIYKAASGVASGHDNDLVSVMAIGASTDGQSFYTYNIVQALDLAAASGCKVINMSFGGESRDRVMHEKIAELYDEGIVMVAAAGNDDTDAWCDPSDMPEVISVTSCGSGRGLSSFSNYGNAKDVAAPGENILNTIPNDKYGYLDGTSMASPMVAGLAALLLDANSSLTPEEVRNIICATTTDNSTFKSKNAGTGIVDANAALTAALGSKSAATSIDIKDSGEKGGAGLIDGTAITEGGITVYEDDDIYLDTVVKPAYTSSDIEWTSSDESKATVDDEGCVTGVSQGEVIITATAGNVSDSCEVMVCDSIPPTGVTITKPASGKATIGIGSNYSLSVLIKPTNSTHKDEVYWSSSNKKVATVDEEGTVTGRAAGTVTITATTYNGKTDTATITVAAPSKVKFTTSTSWVQLGDTFTFSGEVLDKNGTKLQGESIRWEVSNSCASITSNGELKPKKAGTLYVRAYAKNAEKSGYKVYASKKITIAKKNYKGKSDYNLRTVKRYKKSVKVRWKANPIASGYELWRAKGSKGKYKKIKTIKSRTSVTQTVKKLKKGTKYRFKVRAYYYKNGKKKYFSYSNTLTVRTKK